MTVLDLFAGPGGWDQGILPLGIRPLGLELDGTACATGRAAGHRREQQDVAAADPAWFSPVDGILASPPCQGFSRAGKERGRPDGARMTAALAGIRTAGDLRRATRDLDGTMADHRSLLVLEPLRWTLALGPSWTAWEQVPAVLPLWEACAEVLRGQGWSVATGCLQAERYGVPQTRRRAILIGRASWLAAELGPAVLPAPTHSRYYAKDPSRLDLDVAPWVSMADALGWGPTGRPYPTLARERDAGRWALRQSTRSNTTVRRVDEPAPTVTAGKDHGERQWVYRGSNQAHAATRPLGHPAPSVMFSQRSNKVEWMDQILARDTAASGTRVSVAEAAVLQTFPADYPWQGPMTQQYRQVGDAVPPRLALHVVAAALGVAVSVPVADDGEAVA